jgi:invasion protein IalB
MNFWTASAPARPAACALAFVVSTAIVTLAAGPAAFAQTPPATPPAPKAAPKPLPKQTPQAQPPQAAPGGAPQPQAGAGDQPQLIYTPWTKFCLKGQEANAQQVCFTAKDGRIETGQPVVGAALIEPQGEPKKVLRVNLPLGLSLAPGTRVVIDQGQPMNAPYIYCIINGCTADYEASDELVGKLKKGQVLIVQAINGANQPVNLPLPLAGFDKAYDGPPTDPKVFEEQQQKLQDDLQKRAEDARKKLESQQPPTR